MADITTQKQKTYLSNEQLIQEVAKVLEKFKIKRAAIFGSRSRQDYTDKSDIDLIVQFPEGCSLLDLAALREGLESAVGIRVDILTYDSVNACLREKILKEQVRIL